MKKPFKIQLLLINSVIVAMILLTSCSGEKKPANNESTPEEEVAVVEEVKEPSTLDNKGIGPISDVYLGPIDNAMAEEGKAQFETLCIACHKANEKFIGPAPKGILDRRSPEWVMNMIMNPAEMIEKDPIAKQLLEEANGVPMLNQNVTEDNARKLLEYFRTL